MPIYEAPGADIKAPDRAKAERIPVIVCTLSDADSGDTCRYCGFASGAGHGKAR